MLNAVSQAGPEVRKQAEEALEYAVAGWSPKDATMKGLTLQCADGARHFHANPIDTWRVHGGDASWGPMPVDAPDTPEKIEAVARWQVPRLREAFPDGAVGGRILVAEVRRDSVSIRDTGPCEPSAV